MKLMGLLVMAALLSGCQLFPDRPAHAPAVKTISINDTSLTYLEQGTGVPIVLIHGGGSDHRVWEPQREMVAQHYRFVAIDQRYFGTASWTDNGTNFQSVTHIADLAAFIRALGAGSVRLVGTSYGANIALATAVQYPELVHSLFLNEPFLPSILTNPSDQKTVAEEREGLAATIQAAKEGNTAVATRLFHDWVNDQPGSYDVLPPEQRVMRLDNARTLPLQLSLPPITLTCAQLGQIRAPATLTTGELTRPFFKVFAEAIHRCIPASQVVIIPAATHSAGNQQPQVFNEALLKFLSRH